MGLADAVLARLGFVKFVHLSNFRDEAQLIATKWVCLELPGRSTIGYIPAILHDRPVPFFERFSTPTTNLFPCRESLLHMRTSNRLAALCVAFIVILAGCGGSSSIGNPSNGTFSISPGTATVSTNTPLQFSAVGNNGVPVIVNWSVSGGDNGNPGSITAEGLFFPPSSINHSISIVFVTAQLQQSNGNVLSATAKVTVTPGFVQPISPENLAITPGSAVQLIAVLGEVGGGSVTWSLSTTAGGTTPPSGDFGAFSGAKCQTGSQIFTTCAITYTAPATLPAGPTVFATATVVNTTNRQSAQVLLNGKVNSNALSHQTLQSGPVELGTSGGNAFDFDTDSFGNVLDCCGGTLGALLAGSDGQHYVLSTNHVLDNSDQGRQNDAIIQPGLPDTNCDPTQADVVGTLTFAVPLNSQTTNSDAAVATVNSASNGAMQVDPTGNILELGTVGANGQLSAAPPASGSGEAVSAGNVPALVVKSGRSTGLTCSTISSIATTVELQYFVDCAETQPFITKTFQNQILVSGATFSDNPGASGGTFSDMTGDSGSLLIDQANAQPLGLLYATNDSSAVANPVGDVLGDLAQATAPVGGSPTVTFSFVGGAEHPVECLNYGAGTVSAAAPALAPAEEAKGQTAARAALNIVKPQSGLLGTAAGASLDAPSHASVIVYTDRDKPDVTVPAEIGGVRTLVIPVEASSFSSATAAKTRDIVPGIHLNATTLSSAIATKKGLEQQWLSDKAVFGVGVGQSFDNPSEAAIVVLVERGKTPAFMPDVVDGMRVRYEFSDRFHTSHLQGFPSLKGPAGCGVGRSAMAGSSSAGCPTAGSSTKGWKMPAQQVQLP